MRDQGRANDSPWGRGRLVINRSPQRWAKLGSKGPLGTMMSLTSEKNSKLQSPPSRPTPDWRQPPKGASRSRIQRIDPDKARANALRDAHRIGLGAETHATQTVNRIVGQGDGLSASSAKGWATSTGPNTSSCTIGSEAGSPVSRVGSKYSAPHLRGLPPSEPQRPAPPLVHIGLHPGSLARMD